MAVVALQALVACGAAGAAARPLPEVWHYRIEPGDTLIGIARAQLGPGPGWRALQQLNQVRNPRRLVPGQSLRIPLAWLRVQPVRAEVLHVLGEVRVQRGEAAAEPVAAGAMLATGDTLLAGPEASLALKFADGSRLLVRPGSRVRFERLVNIGAAGVPDTRLRLDAGSLDSRVQPAAGRRFEITTPTVNLGVRGTEFRTQVEPQTHHTRVEVLEGAVAAAAGPRIEAGFGVVLGADAPATPRRLLPAPDLASAPARLERVPLRLAWGAQPGVAGYRAQVFAPAAPDGAERLLLDGRFAEPLARWTDLPDGRYELRVRGVDAQGLEGRDARHAFVLKARPEPPFTREPRADARLYGEPTRLSWTQAAGVASYRLQVARQPDFQAPLADLAGLTGTEHLLALVPGRYHWRLASVRADGDAGPWGDAQVFTVRPVPPAPPVQPPALTDAGITLRWAAGEPGHRYELQLARDSAFTELVQQQQTDRPETTLALPPPGQYHLRVRSVDAEGMAGPWGNTQQIEVPGSRWWLVLPLLLLLLGL
ncbi:MAG: FecR domain-containing protein [Burkholderiales bacterium]|nr:FecR domain-containing protein [Burkholderiales bacterium]